ncbi:MAG: hypothetical protein GX442_19050 [Candidatus Riflebacteria bacterium]|nr:hypothetical protein [Candidatus Riflebacteria bacterium]
MGALLAVLLGLTGLAGASAAPPVPVAGADWSSEILYFILLDRFADGDPSNNAEVDRADPYGFHGGDLRGVRDHLDELQQLGATALWISPVFRNRPGRFYEHQPYHGYWPWNFLEVDPRFGTLEELQALSRDLHRRGMKLVLDFVVNHAGYNAPLADHFPAWFHATGNIGNWEDPTERETHRIYGLPDFASERPVVQVLFQAVARHWIDQVHPDGFRLDAVKHVPLSFWREFNGRLAARRGGPGFLLLGEMLDGDPRVIARYLQEGRFSSLFDFPLYYTLKDVIAGGADARKLGSRFFEDCRYPDPNRLGTFLDNHDLDRFLTSCGGDRGRLRQALALLFTVRGMPTLTYGTEAGLAGAAEPRPDNRGDMRFGADPALASWVQALAWLRRRHPSLRQGRQVHLAMSPTTYAFARILPDEVAIVAANTGTATAWLELPAGRLFADRTRLPDRLGTGVAEVWGPRFECEVRPGQVAVFLDAGLSAARAAAWRQALALHADPRSAGKVPVTFLLRAENLPGGAVPLVIGGIAELGSWDAGAALPEMTRAGPGRWRATVEVPRHAVFEAKFCCRTASQTLWFPGDNLFVETGDRPPAPLSAVW